MFSESSQNASNPIHYKWIGLILSALLVVVTAVLSPVRAEPLTLTDLAGREVKLERPITRFVMSEGRYIPLLALLRPGEPTAGLVGTMSGLGDTDPALQAQLFEQFPQSRDIPRFGTKSADSVSVEKIIDLAPQLAIFGLSDHGPGSRAGELIDQLSAAGVAVVFIDFRLDPLKNTLPSIELLGRILGEEARASDYSEFYRARVEMVRQRTAGVRKKPSVFLQVHPGRFECCWGMAEGMLGPFVELAGGTNIADAVAPGPTAQHTAEFLLTENPDIWIGTASGTSEEYLANASPVALGARMSREMAAESLRRYLSAPEFQALDAVRNGRAHSIWHNFYNSPFNIVALEAFAKWIHPEVFQDIDPHTTLRTIFERFTPFQLEGTYSASVRRD